MDKDITLLDFPLPDEIEIRRVLDQMIAANTAGWSHPDRGRLILVESGSPKAALGLTLHEATNAFARAMVDDGVLSNDDVHVVMEEKKQTVRKAGLLEFITVDISPGRRRRAAEPEAMAREAQQFLARRGRLVRYPGAEGCPDDRRPGLRQVADSEGHRRGVGAPLLRLDIGKVFAGLVGSSEQNMRAAIRTAEATAPCILWLDEIEKGFSGIGGGGDSGTSSRVFGSFLTWMQEKTAPVFVIATANKVDAPAARVPAEGTLRRDLLRRPADPTERRDIWQLHLYQATEQPQRRGGDSADRGPYRPAGAR